MVQTCNAANRREPTRLAEEVVQHGGVVLGPNFAANMPLMIGLTAMLVPAICFASRANTAQSFRSILRWTREQAAAAA